MDPRPRNRYVSAMSTVAEIEAALPKLTTSELAQIERALDNQYRQRGGGIVYDGSGSHSLVLNVYVTGPTGTPPAL